ncbi:DUF4834 family protein [Marinoscillum sp.]|uniref:DUF4834 family protein n=1 Tax=Marinoscillum sp. TaxID=2024838 RepID=UPI003BAD3060
MFLKFILILILVAYLFVKVGGYLFGLLFRGAQEFNRGYQAGDHQHHARKAPNSNLNIDHIPQKDKQSKKNFGGGEYVDFEEVK